MAKSCFKNSFGFSGDWQLVTVSNVSPGDWRLVAVFNLKDFKSLWRKLDFSCFYILRNDGFGENQRVY